MNMESRITFHSGPLLLEGRINPGSKTHAAIITHPHTLYGGELSHPVVEAVAKTHARMGRTTLRFNFRGAGRSQGTYDHGIGEQQDVLAAINLLTAGGVHDIHLTGYSFGAWVNGHISCLPPEVSALVLISPPVAFMEYRDSPAQPLLQLVLAGSDDEIAPPALIKRYLPSWNPTARLVIIEAADHFFSGRLGQLEEELASHLTLQTSG